MQTFLMCVVILVLLTPLLLFYGLPFIFAAWLFFTRTASRLDPRPRLVVACGVAALGIAPLFDDYWAPKSTYLLLWSGTPVNPWAALASFALTWLVLMLQARPLVRHRVQGA